MKAWIKKNKEMTMTIICAIFIIIGFFFDWRGDHQLAIIAYLLACVIGGLQSFKNAWHDLVDEHKLNVDILMILAAAGACMIGHWVEGALLIFIFSLAESLESMAMARTTDSISALMHVTPDVARLVKDDGEISEVPTKSLKIGDTVQVRKGESVPIDGTLLSDIAILNEVPITGESLPVTKEKGDEIVGGTINEDEVLLMRVSVTDQDTLFAKIIRMVEEAQNAPSKTDSYIQSIENTYVKVVLIVVPLFILLMPWVTDWSYYQSFYRGMVLLTVASPCALVASSAPANLSAISRASKNGVLFKGGEVIDRVAEINMTVFDKTGTLTKGQPEVVDTLYRSGADQKVIEQIVKSAESTSTHPIAQAFMAHLEHVQTVDFEAMQDITGKGFAIKYVGDDWRVGNRHFAFEGEDIDLPSDIETAIHRLESEGKSIIFVTKNHSFQAAYALADQLKSDSRATIEALHELDIHSVMLTDWRRRENGDTHCSSAQYR